MGINKSMNKEQAIKLVPYILIVGLNVNNIYLDFSKYKPALPQDPPQTNTVIYGTGFFGTSSVRGVIVNIQSVEVISTTKLNNYGNSYYYFPLKQD